MAPRVAEPQVPAHDRGARLRRDLEHGRPFPLGETYHRLERFAFDVKREMALDHADRVLGRSDALAAGDAIVNEKWRSTDSTPGFRQPVLKGVTFPVDRADRALEQNGWVFARIRTARIRKRCVHDLKPVVLPWRAGAKSLCQGRQIPEGQIKLLLELRCVVSPRDEAAVHANANGSAGGTEHERHSEAATDNSYPLNSIEEGAEFGDHCACYTRHSDRPERPPLDDIRGNELRLVGPRAQVEIGASLDDARARQPIHQQSNRSPARRVRTGIADQHPRYSSPMSQACSRSFFEYARNAVRVCVDLIPGTTVTSSVTIRAIASCSATSIIATRSHSPETE